jgi:hypothetical protein
MYELHTNDDTLFVLSHLYQLYNKLDREGSAVHGANTKLKTELTLAAILREIEALKDANILVIGKRYNVAFLGADSELDGVYVFCSSGGWENDCGTLFLGLRLTKSFQRIEE